METYVWKKNLNCVVVPLENTTFENILTTFKINYISFININNDSLNLILNLLNSFYEIVKALNNLKTETSSSQTFTCNTKFNETYVTIANEINLNYKKILLDRIENDFSINISDCEKWFNQLEITLDNVKNISFSKNDMKKIGKN